MGEVPNAISRISCHHHHNFLLLLVQTCYLHTGTNPSANFSTKRLRGGWRCARTSSIRFYMLYVTTAFRHALRGETVNDAIFVDSSMRTSLRMKEGGAGLPMYNYSMGII